MVILSAALTLGAAVLAAPGNGWPRFSWDTIQPFIHLANNSGPFSDAAIDAMARFPIVTVEKSQGPCAAQSKPPTDTCGEEQLIIDTLRRVKQANASATTIFYLNSVLNFPQYDLSARFVRTRNSVEKSAGNKKGHNGEVFCLSPS